MQKSIVAFGVLSLALGCSASRDEKAKSESELVVLDVRCDTNGDCPVGFECETEKEDGASTSYCKSHQSSGAGDRVRRFAMPGPGFEQETEHGGVFCKAHGRGDDGGRWRAVRSRTMTAGSDSHRPRSTFFCCRV